MSWRVVRSEARRDGSILHTVRLDDGRTTVVRVAATVRTADETDKVLAAAVEAMGPKLPEGQ